MENPIFKGCSAKEQELFIKEAPCIREGFEKGQLLLKQGDRVTDARLLLEGSVKAYHLTPHGREQIHNILSKGQLVGFVLMSGEENRSPVTVEALSAGELLHIPLQAILHFPGEVGDRIRLNLLSALSKRCWELTNRLEYLQLPTLRAKLSRFLLNQAQRHGALRFTLEMNRESMAALLGANRSALSRELGRMSRDGLLSWYKNSFVLLDKNKLWAIAEGEGTWNE